MLSTLSTSLAGMSAAAQQIAVSAANIAASGTVPGAGLSAQQTTGPDGTPTVEVRQVRTNSTPVSGNGTAGAGDTTASSQVDPIQELLQMLEAQQSFAANAHTASTVADVFRSLYGNLQD